MSLVEMWLSYFGSALPLSVGVGAVTFLVGAFLTLRTRAMGPVARSRLLLTMFADTVFLWSFVGFSLLFCARMLSVYYADELGAIRLVLASSLLLSAAVAAPLAVAMRWLAPIVVLRRLRTRPLHDPILQSVFEALRQKLGVGPVQALVSQEAAPVSVALGGEHGPVIVSQGLLNLLTPEETETVLAHELAHIREGDLSIKAFATIYCSIIRFDPLLRLIEAAMHREREFLADSLAARATGKPLSLATALIKIHRALGGRGPSYLVSFSAAGGTRGLFSRHPPLQARVRRLIVLARQLQTSVIPAT